MGASLYTEIADRLRQDIIGSVVVPGQRLPTRVELEKRFDTTPMTLNRAMKLLTGEGFITARYGSGTNVADHPPHLSHFALAFPFKNFQDHCRFYVALRDEAAKLQGEERRILPFYDIEYHVDEEDYLRLLGSVQAQRLAGLIFASNPAQLAMTGSPLVYEPGVHRVAIMLPNNAYTFPTVYPDYDSLLPTAFDYLAARGRKRVAVILRQGSEHAGLPSLQALATGCGLTLRPHWLQASTAGAFEWARQIALLLLHGRACDRPDSVVIVDDNLVEGFTAGIRDSGVRVAVGDELYRKGDLEVVAHANFPYPTRSWVPAKRLGYNITELMSVCMDLIEQQRQGKKVASHTTIPAEFEEN